jgi:hypothetical protein
MKTHRFARATTETEVLDLAREEHREKLGRVVRIMSEQAVYAELARLAHAAREQASPLRPLDASAVRTS